MIKVDLTELQFKRIGEAADKLRKAFLDAAKNRTYEQYLEFVQHSEVMLRNINNFKNAVHDISGRKVRMSDQKLIELFDDIWDDDSISRLNISRLFLEAQQLQQFDKNIAERQKSECASITQRQIEDIRRGMGVEEFCDKYATTFRRYRVLKDRCLSDTAPCVIKRLL